MPDHRLLVPLDAAGGSGARAPPDRMAELVRHIAAVEEAGFIVGSLTGMLFASVPM